jgi:hypothetical protein
MVGGAVGVVVAVLMTGLKQGTTRRKQGDEIQG